MGPGFAGKRDERSGRMKGDEGEMKGEGAITIVWE